MSTKNLSLFPYELMPDAVDMRIGIAVSEWNSEITENLLKGAREVLTQCGISLDNLHIVYVPGSFELPLAAQLLFDNKRIEAVICLGSVIRGETSHFEYVCNACSLGIKDVSLKMKKPVVFGVLTDDTLEQAHARSGGVLGNKGTEAAVTAIKMIALQRELDQ